MENLPCVAARRKGRGLRGENDMFVYIEGYSDTDEICCCPFCGEIVSNFHADGTATCSECDSRFAVIKYEED